jgi:hypothetical protein
LSKSEASDDHLPSNRILSPFDVVKGEGLTGGHTTVDISLTNFEALLGPESHIQVLPVRVGKGKGREKESAFFTEVRPFMLVKRLNNILL